MKPGRELDALVAEKVMGWTKGVTGWAKPGGGGCLDLPEFSEDIAAAMRVLHAVTQRLGTDYYPILMRPYADWFAGFSMSYPDCCDWEATAEGLPEAICLAALKAVGAL